MALPRIHGEGRIIGQPEMRHTANGKPVLQMRVVANRRRLNPQTNEWENTGECWTNLALWEKAAERNDGYLQDKDLIVYDGELETRQFERRDGTKGLSVDVRVDNIGKVAPYVSGGGGQQSSGQFQQGTAGGSWGGQDDSPPF